MEQALIGADFTQVSLCELLLFKLESSINYGFLGLKICTSDQEPQKSLKILKITLIYSNFLKVCLKMLNFLENTQI